MKTTYLSAALLGAALTAQAADQPAPAKPTPATSYGHPGTNFDEAKVGDLPIPDVLTAPNGEKITTKEAWEKHRAELLDLFAKEEYGKTPGGRPANFGVELISENKQALGGKATLRQVALYFKDKSEPHADVLLYLPNQNKAPAPVFVSLNFTGNQSVTNDPSIQLSKGWFRNDEKKGYVNHQATDATRNAAGERWPIEEIIARGYGVATAYYGDFEPDTPEGLPKGVRPLFYKEGQTAPEADEWGAIGAWAWGLSRMADYLNTVPEVNHQHLAVLGHSRLGKTALWAGAQDERFSIVISNCSGASGAALSKRIFGETCANIIKSFPHWMCQNFRKYGDNEAALPMDQHQLIALMAPRPVYIASATEDLWADPKGEFLAGKLANPVYALYGEKGLSADAPPAPDTSVGDYIGYHARTGKHNILLFDWQQYMNFADRHWGKPE